MGFSYCILLLTHLAWADEIRYPVKEIPEELKKDAHVVVRESKLSFTILSSDKSRMNVRSVYTIMNSNGGSYAVEVAGYDKDSKISSFKAVVYDADGKVIKKLKSNEIRDIIAYDGFSLFSDSRLKIADLTQGKYPYTVEFEYEVSYDYVFAIPQFQLVRSAHISVQKSTYELSYPPSLKPRFKTKNITNAATVTQTGNVETTAWNFANSPSQNTENMTAGLSEIVPTIYAAPSQFNYHGYTGKMDTWADYGKWINTLNSNRDLLPEATKQKVREIVSRATSPEEKVRLLYEYLQHNTRYVSIQLGVGGYQPFEANVVDKVGYGDCKALSNFMVALLKEAGIKANYTLVYGGPQEQSLMADFPSPQFNHAIVMVPLKGDTIWLECTSQSNPFGYLGNFTGNRRALAITADGASVVRTKHYSADDNVQRTKGTIQLTAGGDAMLDVAIRFAGLQYENGGVDGIATKTNEEQKKWVKNNLSLPNMELETVNVVDDRAVIPSVTLSSKLKVTKYATVSGKRLFVNPNVLNKTDFGLAKSGDRKTDVLIRKSFTDYDSLHFLLPDGIYPEFLPETVEVKSRYGEYKATFKVGEHGLIYERKLMLKEGRYPPNSYGELVDFLQRVSKADNTKLVFINKT